jgi:hypothetical protein
MVKETNPGMNMLTKKSRSNLAKQAVAGQDIGKKGKMFDKVAATAAEQYGSVEAGQKVAAAAMIKARAQRKRVPK